MKKIIQFWFVSSIACSCITTTSLAQAQIVPDASLPNNSSIINEANVSNITEGTQAGSNLFHSFQQFSVPTNGVVYFNNALDIQNIISRVTGSSISNIDGLLRANGGANLFLLNPNGIIFGPNASLNIGGSFVGSTASSLNFADGTSFGATASQTTPLLSISVPIGLGFVSNPGAIQAQGTGHNLRGPSFSPVLRSSNSTSGLQVRPGKTLALVGGDVTLDGSILTASGGKIELGSVNTGSVSISSTTSGGWTLGYEAVPYFRDIYLNHKALLDASGAGGSDIQLQGQGVTLADGSVILIQNQGLLPGGTLSIKASEFIEIISGTDARIATSLRNETLGFGNGGDITVLTKRLVIQDGGQINNFTFSSAAGGNTIINASDFVQLIGVSPNDSSVFSVIGNATFKSGNAGDLTVSTPQISAINGGLLTSATFGTGKGGNLTVNAANSVELIGVEPKGLTPATFAATALNAGNAGNLTINTSKLVVRDGGRLDSSTLATGSAGNVNINASNSVEVSGTVPGSQNPTLVISSANTVDKSLQQLFRLPPEPSGASGNVTINTARLSVTNGAQVTVRNDGTGNAGNLQINANSINLNNQGGITASTNGGEGGNIFLQAQNLLMRDNSIITATAGGTGNGGNITIDTDTLAALDNSDISANAQGARGGQVIIDAQGIFGTQFRNAPTSESDITATGGSPELSGKVEINTPDVNPAIGLATLPEELVDASNQIAQGCPAGVGPTASKFVITGRGGIPENPNEPLNGETFVEDWGTLTRSKGELQNELLRARNRPENRESDPIVSTNPSDLAQIVEATGWVTNAKGEVFLIAEAPNAETTVPWLHSTNCHAP